MSDKPDFIGAICDEYMDIKKPGYRDKLAETVAPEIEKSLSGRTPAEADQDVDRFLADYYQSFIKDGAPFDGEQARRMVKDRREREGGGHSTGDRFRDQRLVALRAFHKVDQRRGTTAEAKAEALQAIAEKWPHGDHEKSVRNWLKQIYFLTDIKQSPRGRPKKIRKS